MKEMKVITNTINMLRKLKRENVTKLIIVTLSVIFLSCISIFIQYRERSVIKINGKQIKKQEGKIAVYMSGAINNPGVYNFKEGIRLEEALNVIGGITKEADISKINLSRLLYDSEKIVVPYIQKETEENIFSNSIDSNQEKININEANEEELIKLPGIGGATAKKIIEYRKNGNFESIEDIKKVPGIGNSKFDKIKDKITVE